MAAKFVEAVVGGANTFTGELAFLGRVNVLVEPSSPSWAGTVVLQRRYRMPNGSWSDWRVVGAITVPSVNAFVEHENDVQYRVGTLTGLTGGTPLVRLSQ